MFLNEDEAEFGRNLSLDLDKSLPLSQNMYFPFLLGQEKLVILYNTDINLMEK